MSVGALRPSVVEPDVSDLLVRARCIAVVARELAQQTETDRRVGDDMIERMGQADLFRVMQPRAYGGFEYGFEVFAQIVAAIASGCGSTGGVYALLASPQWLLACFLPAGAAGGGGRGGGGPPRPRRPPAPMRRSLVPSRWMAATGCPASAAFAAAATMPN